MPQGNSQLAKKASSKGKKKEKYSTGQKEEGRGVNVLWGGKKKREREKVVSDVWHIAMLVDDLQSLISDEAIPVIFAIPSQQYRKKKKGKHERTHLPKAFIKGISRKIYHPRLRKKRTELNSNTSKKKKKTSFLGFKEKKKKTFNNTKKTR